LLTGIPEKFVNRGTELAKFGRLFSSTRTAQFCEPLWVFFNLVFACANRVSVVEGGVRNNVLVGIFPAEFVKSSCSQIVIG
jgi:hypothetical protein